MSITSRYIKFIAYNITVTSFTSTCAKLPLPAARPAPGAARGGVRLAGHSDGLKIVRSCNKFSNNSGCYFTYTHLAAVYMHVPLFGCVSLAMRPAVPCLAAPPGPPRPPLRAAPSITPPVPAWERIKSNTFSIRPNIQMPCWPPGTRRRDEGSRTGALGHDTQHINPSIYRPALGNLGALGVRIA